MASLIPVTMILNAGLGLEQLMQRVSGELGIHWTGYVSLDTRDDGTQSLMAGFGDPAPAMIIHAALTHHTEGELSCMVSRGLEQRKFGTVDLAALTDTEREDIFDWMLRQARDIFDIPEGESRGQMSPNGRIVMEGC